VGRREKGLNQLTDIDGVGRLKNRTTRTDKNRDTHAFQRDRTETPTPSSGRKKPDLIRINSQS
jgi:hypothetical protein